MSNEEIAENLEVTPLDGSVDMVFRREAALRLRDGMYWLPMTENAKFDNGEVYLLNTETDWFMAFYWADELAFELDNEPETYYFPNRFTHYVKLTDPTNHFPQTQK